ncbi:hypothetical protein Pmar_PMAR027134 [Perkinsus marinus ATCC 50983]|uniref:Uncharacterized protein n=1 Tax=Perkinsus marinus (strain ATCC 50983 / TXsc) TaxID=423536 RepID=C5L8E4_PERM5|nr:hypothetical protein Pmar_PMAR026336 [Perkinsus marinus ATCC 50983]XP_002775183.1 hypothetical protein Pmar_PMAR027134 [Perkinsus marinus ATCC 50983]EER04878.1 hypothetical protein Pmar_PMAR026336 [Perkinsus marinus ATCC 50983]EER06999.1 hypothetical protein Pmar_PMAR027134 [Perkinsus marinus ATCC 50983]|eukprot:XP_002773062.1 hypothetical protein Pmar_PMAR026336 [Perkinsus marinus ATCC 50983]
MSSPDNDLGIQKKDLSLIEEQARADATAAGMDDDATQYHIRLAVDHARDYNDLFDALSTRAEAGSVRPQAPVIDSGHKEELRVNLQMPKRYRMYLTDEFYEMWDQYASKQTFEEDSRIMA